jgi:hypothetical protein
MNRKSGGEPPHSKSDGGDEGAVGIGVAVGHARSVEGIAGRTVFVEEDEAASTFAATGEKLDAGLRGARRIRTRGAKEIARGFGEDDFHDGFTVSGRRNRTGFAIRVTAAADQGRIADTSGKFATSAAGGSGGEETALIIERDGTDCTLFMAAMMFSGMGIFAATLPGVLFGGGNEFFRVA